jgi:mannose-6-phosphate isomerase-like protein (cupin superfamily)
MIIEGSKLEEKNGRKPYPIADSQRILHHLSVYDTRPANPFVPHKHEREEIWYIIEGEAIVTIDGQDSIVKGGDVILLAAWVEHGLRSESRARWVCLG